MILSNNIAQVKKHCLSELCLVQLADFNLRNTQEGIYNSRIFLTLNRLLISSITKYSGKHKIYQSSNGFNAPLEYIHRSPRERISVTGAITYEASQGFILVSLLFTIPYKCSATIIDHASIWMTVT